MVTRRRRLGAHRFAVVRIGLRQRRLAASPISATSTCRGSEQWWLVPTGLTRHLRAFLHSPPVTASTPEHFSPAYGLAEMTLIATGQRLGEPIRMTRVDRSTLRVGHPVRVVDSSGDGLSVEPSGDWVVSVGHPAPGHDVRIVDESGQPTTEEPWERSCCAGRR